MVSKINVEEILNQFPSRDDKNEYILKSDAKKAIKEIVEAVVDRCAEEVDLTEFAAEFMQEGVYEAVDKQSILKVKEHVEYGIESLSSGRVLTADQFNKKYKDFLEEGHYGLDVHDKEVVEYLDRKFQEYIKIPGFSYSQIKLKFSMGRFYCEKLDRAEVDEIENWLTEFYKQSKRK